MFEIEAPDDGFETEPAATEPSRRGPMASAVRETADSLRERGALEAAIRAENDALAHDHVRLKRAGLIIQPVPTHLVDATKLTRDRASDRDADLAELKASIMALGLSNPIRVEPTPGGRYELIQGWRRLRAFIELEGEHRDGRFTLIPACHAPAGDALETSYRRMVDENLVRRDVSFAEMAQLARRYAADPATGCDDVDRAVAALFRSAGYQKRSYIRAFVELLDRLADALAHPQALSRNLGLDLRRALDATPGLADRLRAALAAAPGRSAEEETEILRRVLAGAGAQAASAKAAGATPPDRAEGGRADPAAARRLRRVSLAVETAAGPVRCVAAEGRLTLWGPADFAGIAPRRMERALRAFMRALSDETDG
jgi:ParB family chromosome partitioning protein